VLAAIVLWGFIASPNFLRHCGTTLQITISVIWLFAAHWRFRRGNFELRWDDQHAQILNHGAIVFDGKFAEMALIDQDLRGYYLYPLNHNDVYRLKRSFVDAELQQALDAR